MLDREIWLELELVLELGLVLELDLHPDLELELLLELELELELDLELLELRMALVLWALSLLGSACLVSANIFEYQVDAQPLRPCELRRERALRRRADYVAQCAEDGRFQTIQCLKDGSSCWCVSADGREVPGSRQPGRPVACLSFCQLHKQQILLSSYLNSTATSYLPQCQDSGEYMPVQCDLRREQCWCVDTEGMEVYGTRQLGRPTRCPESCEIRNRRLLHGVGDKSPPQCSPDGRFLPVQCKFVNTTDMMVFDLVHNYNRFPDAFVTFSAFRRRFPEVSGYCHCADSQGRELAETGLELLLDEIYDTIFAGLDLAATFTQTTLYRILQRRFLAVQLVLSGRFRCPTKCEVERFTATNFGHPYIPSCHRDGAYQAVQCQREGPCWCVDAQGREVRGTRRPDASLPCAGDQSCSSERRRALSRLHFGPLGDFSLHSMFSAWKGAGSAMSCPPMIKELFVDSGILRPMVEGRNQQFSTSESLLTEAIRGIFPSRDLARLALQFTTNPKQLQQNLFGGKFLANVGQFNLSGALGTRSTFNFSQFFQQLGLPGLQNGGGHVDLSKPLSAGLDSNPAVETPRAIKKGSTMNKTIVGSFGFDINLQENQNALTSLASLLDLPEFLLFLQHAVSVPEDIARDLGDVMEMVLSSRGCEPTPGRLFVPSCTAEGSYEDVQCFAGVCWCVDSQGKELPGSRVRGGQPRCPTECEKQRARMQSLSGSQPAGSSLFVPSCTSQGHFLPVQCFNSECYCVDAEGQVIPGTRSVPGQPKQCPTPCQLQAEQAFLQVVRTLVSNSSMAPTLSSVYIPQCSTNGQWSRMQCDGPPEQAFEWYEGWRAQNDGGRELTAAELLMKILSYREAASRSFSLFIQSLYEAGQQGIFPGLARYSSLQDVPLAVLEGNWTQPGKNVFLEPYVFWQILNGQLRRYPGPYSDFSTPLAHFDLRTCWCVDEAGQELEGTRTEPGKVPACPGSCEEAKLRVLRFIKDTEEMVLASNNSWFPLGESFLAAKGIQLTNEELGLPPLAPPRGAFLEQFLSGSDYALRLAAQSTFDFYQSGRFSLADSSGASPLRSSSYVPQCDAFGSWEPVQCHTETGYCWCVGKTGDYVPASLTARSSQLPQCPTTCEKSRASGLLSSWKQAGSQGDPSPKDLFIPTCLQTGEFARLQVSEAGIWCVDQASGEGTPPSTNSSAQCPGLCESLQSGIPSRRLGPGYTPACEAEDGSLSPVQCDPTQDSCWCVFGSGEEVPGTRVAGSRPACESPQCPLPFNVSDVTGGVILCERASGPRGATVQLCQLLCRQGYQSAFRPMSLVCSLETRRWLSQPPQPLACQRLQLWQTLQTQAQFQLRLPPGKMCSADYSGLLLAFQVFISDELRARGFCQVQVKLSGTPVSVPVCDDSVVQVECLTAERLGVNVTWKLRLEDVPPASLPDLHDVEEALVGKDLVGRFADLVQSGMFQFHLDSKTFLADTSIHFLQGDSFGPSPRTRYGCLEGFHPVAAPSNASQDPLGCVKCPEGSYFQDEQCVPCPAGFYQEWAGSLTCTPCPVGRTTASEGAFSQTHCVTDCQRNEAGLQCDQDGQYRASQMDRDSGRAFCVDNEGRRLPWSEMEAPLTDSQCLMMQKFEKAPEPQVIFDASAAEGVRSQVPGSESPLKQCLADCALDQACSFLTVSTVGSEVSCEFYAWTSDNIACTVSGQDQDAAGNSKATGFGSLRCQVKVRSGGQDSPAVYLKKGQEFSTRSQKSFEPTGFQNVLSGMYSPAVFPGSGTNRTEVHLFCLLSCDRDTCCDGFVLTQVQGGPIICGLLSSPDVLLCHVNDWRDPSKAKANATCPGVTYDQGSRQVTLQLGGQEFKSWTPLEGTQDTLTSFQQVYLWKDSDMGSRSESMGCGRDTEPRASPPPETDLTTELFSPVDLEQVVVRGNRSLPSQQHWLFKHLFSAQQANVWCLSRCVQEPSFCQLAEIRDSAPLYFTCTLYPEAQVCDDVLESRPTGCRLILPHRPSALFRKKGVLKDKVKSFYTRLPFQKLAGVSVRSKAPMPDKAISDGFFECERLCDVDPCCSGFGFLNVSQLKGGEVTCLTLNSLGLQTCSEESGGTWRILDCGSSDIEVRTYPFGWYQKPVAQNDPPSFCPPVVLPSLSEKVPLDSWQTLALSSAVVDPSIRDFDVAHISMAATSDFSAARDLCLLECSRHQACQVTTLQTRPGTLRCVFYADTQICTHSLQAQYCQLLLREEATHIYWKLNIPLLGLGTSAPSVTIAPHGRLLGRSQAVQVGTSWKQVDQFLGVPFAAPPLAESRFGAPEPLNWTGPWAATAPRASCWQPGIATPASSRVSEDCLYLNVFVPQSVTPNASVLVFFHNTMATRDGEGGLALDGSFLAAIGNLIVVTAGYRVGIFGFLSSGSGEVSGNWGLLDQVAVLTWVQTHIRVFGGDPRRVTMAADRGGADVASIHLLTFGAGGSRLFRRAVLMGGSALSPAAVISRERAQQQAAALSKEVSCPTSSIQEMISCLRQKPASILNDAQTKLLAVSGPFHYWGPVIDGQYLREAPARALQRVPQGEVDLLIGSSQDDGLISRAKAVKQFEESQGRTSSKTAFYRALQNSLGGEDATEGVRAAATWYYSLEHSADDYASFSRALEAAARDYFITCPVIDMASQWARRARGNVFMYHAPQSYGHGSLDLLTDVQYAFGLPLHPAYEGQFTQEEKSTSLKVLQYFSNFIRSGNPNYPHEFSRKVPEFAVPWPDFVPGADGENYKEFSALLPNRRGLKKADCSFWSKYIRSLKAPADEAKDELSAANEEDDQPAGSGLREELLGLPDPGPKSYSK
ncbi:PREDICTED: thyroglobulin [Miniopterus natalensis]|uniref:thyroglobulin n=1 Tax=Miniopterus natalensis TaxID=291302 RepID=UPI0007A72255|nr:PREDICTED: thyroglobulin [Miniopterus natalensis]